MDWDEWPHLEHAACRATGTQVDWWFPERGERTDRARKICASCPHQVDCAEFGVAHPDLIGIWGGLSQRERIQAARQRRILAPGSPGVDDGGIDDDTVTFTEPNVSSNGYHEPETADLCAICTAPIPPRRVAVGSKTCGKDVCAEAHRRVRRTASDARRRAQNAATPATLAAVASNGAGMNGSASAGLAADEGLEIRHGVTDLVRTSSPEIGNGVAGLPGLHPVAYLLDGGILLPILTRGNP